MTLHKITKSVLLVTAILIFSSQFAEAQKSGKGSSKSSSHGHGTSGSKSNGGGNSGKGGNMNFGGGQDKHGSNQSIRTNDHDDHQHGSNFGNNSRGYSQLNISPFGLGYSYSGRNFGFGAGNSGYYQPFYGGYGGGYGNGYSGMPYYGNDYGYNSMPYYGNDLSYYSPQSAYGYTPYSSNYQPNYGYDPTFSYPPYSNNLSNLSAGSVGLGESPTNSMSAPKLSFPVILTKAAAISSQQRAEAAFRDGRYAEAADLASQSVRLDQENGMARLFSAQTQFAIGNYEQSAAELLVATSLLPNDKWNQVVTNFRAFYGKNDYVSQTEQLSQRILQVPNDVAARVVRGFHYGALGYPESASEDFYAAIAVKRNDVLAKRLLPVFGTGILPVQSPQQLQEPVPTGVPPRLDPLSLPNGEVGIATPQRVIQLIPQDVEGQVPDAGSSDIPLESPQKSELQTPEELPPGILQQPKSVLNSDDKN